jgi:hypothetical protein
VARSLHFVPGAHWYAGLDLPFYLPRSSVSSGAQDMGFRNIVWHDRDGAAPPVNPRSDPQYSDDWDEWAEGVYVGPERDHTIPWEVPWLAFENPPQPAIPQPAPVASPMSLDDRVRGIVRVALESGDPASMRAAARLMSAQGFPQLAADLERQAEQTEAAAHAAAPSAPHPEPPEATETPEPTRPPEPPEAPEAPEAPGLPQAPEPAGDELPPAAKLAIGGIVLDLLGGLLFWAILKGRKRK